MADDALVNEIRSWVDQTIDYKERLTLRSRLPRLMVRGELLLDLRGADLRGANLQEADLSFTDLDGADLRGADCRGASFYESSLQRAILSAADLSELHSPPPRPGLFGLTTGTSLGAANLMEADLSFSNLTGACLDWANLTGANLSGAILCNVSLNNADFKGARLSETVFTNCSISELKNLEAVVHQDPATVEHLTNALTRSDNS